MNQDKEKQFFRLFMQHQRAVFCYILMNVRNADDARDLMQEAAVIMWQKYSVKDPEDRFSAWAVAIARNLIKRYYQRLKRNHLIFNDDLLAEIEDRSRVHLESYEDYLVALRKCLAKLDVRQRQLLNLKYERGMKVKEISMHVRRSTEAIYKIIARTQAALLRCIQKSMAE
ncbi:MAG: sigma-70 family RNA polymerase sigma factor [Planctomycetes bacterium]|nr:sigma-70 family RNA polymerase sigma factor [Planctomycetota bacterium]